MFTGLSRWFVCGCVFCAAHCCSVAHFQCTVCGVLWGWWAFYSFNTLLQHALTTLFYCTHRHLACMHMPGDRQTDRLSGGGATHARVWLCVAGVSCNSVQAVCVILGVCGGIWMYVVSTDPCQLLLCAFSLACPVIARCGATQRHHPPLLALLYVPCFCVCLLALSLQYLTKTHRLACCWSAVG